MFTTRVYTCRTLENVLKVALFIFGYVLFILVDIWSEPYIHSMKTVGPMINGKSLPAAMVRALFRVMEVFIPVYSLGVEGVPSALQFFWLKLEANEEGLRYALPRWQEVRRGFARWNEIKTMPETESGLPLKIGDNTIWIPRHISHYAELTREIKGRCPETPATSMLEDKVDTDPELLDDVYAEIRAGRRLQAIKLLVSKGGLDTSQASFYVNDWADENGFGKPQAEKYKPNKAAIALFSYAWAVIIYLYA